MSCTEACKSKGLTCDVDSILSIATDLSTCNETIQKLGKTAASQGTFTDDNSGCTYHPNGNGWYQLMNNGYPTTCDVKNSDGTRQRVCSCKGKIRFRQYSLQRGLSSLKISNITFEKPDFLFTCSEKSIPTMALTSGFWLGATYLNSDYIFDGNLGKVNKFNLTASNSVSYFSQVMLFTYFKFEYLNLGS